MSNTFVAKGNLGSAPELKTVQVNGEAHQVADLRLYCDRLVPDGESGFKDKGGFWLNVSAWDRRGEHAARVLAKGMRIKVEGTLVQNAWEKDGEERSRLELKADDITLDLGRIESVALRAKKSQPADNSDGAMPADNGGHPVATSDSEAGHGE